MSETYRPELPRPIPARIKRLPVSRGYPVPWFVTWLNDAREPVERGTGEPDFRVITAQTVAEAVTHKLCWVCGQRLGKHMSFVIGPMCIVNLNSAEPPSHLECADWAARACPFLTRPHMRRNDSNLPDGAGEEHVAGIMLARNPGVAAVWTTTSYRIRSDGRDGVLFRIGKPHDVRWYCEGRPATRAEVQHSIDTGLPKLEELAAADDALPELALEVKRAEQLLPVL